MTLKNIYSKNLDMDSNILFFLKAQKISGYQTKKSTNVKREIHLSLNIPRIQEHKILLIYVFETCVTSTWNHLFQVILSVIKIYPLHKTNNQLTFWEHCPWQQYKLKQNNKNPVAMRNPIFILSSILAKLGRKNKLKFVLELRDLGSYRSPWAGAPSTCNKWVLWTASISFCPIPAHPKQAVEAGGSFDSLGRIQAIKLITSDNIWTDLRPSPI